MYTDRSGAGRRRPCKPGCRQILADAGNAVAGLVINWTAAGLQKLHVDPMTGRTDVVIDGTGHDAEVCSTVARKIPGAFPVVGEKPM